MLIDLTQDNLYSSLCSQKLRADKTGYLALVERAVNEHGPFVSFSAPHGLGVSTFLDMINAFYGDRYPTRLFMDTAISRDGDIMSRRGRYLELTYDFAEVTATTSYNELITKLCEETHKAAMQLFPDKVRGNSDYDFGRSLLSLSNIAGKKLVISFKNFDRVQRYAIKSLNILHAWERLFVQLLQLNSRNDFIYILAVGSHISGMVDLLVNPEHPNQKLFFSLTGVDSPYSDEMYGWCGITQDELSCILQGCFSKLDPDDLYDWCGHYDNGLMRPASVFASIVESDLIMTVNIDSGMWYVKEILESGFGAYLLCGEVGVARLLNGEHISMHQMSRYDPRKPTPYAQEIYNFTRRFLNMLCGEGLITVSRQFKENLDNAALVNTEIRLSVSDAVSETTDYVGTLTKIVAGRTDLTKAFSRNNIQPFVEILLKYIAFKRKHTSDKSPVKITIWQAVYDLLIDLPGYRLIPLDNVFVLAEEGGESRYLVICVGVNSDGEKLLDDTVNLRINDLIFNQAIEHYKGRLPAFICNVTLDSNPEVEPKCDTQVALVV